MSLQSFLDGYLQCALWSSTYREDGRGQLDDGVHDWAPASLELVRQEAAKWYAQHGDTITAAYNTGAVRERDHDGQPWNVDAQAGHDFWLTRCGHGAGFWDGDWPEPYASQLSDAARAAGNVDLYVGDDGRIYAAGMEG